MMRVQVEMTIKSYFVDYGILLNAVQDAVVVATYVNSLSNLFV